MPMNTPSANDDATARAVRYFLDLTDRGRNILRAEAAYAAACEAYGAEGFTLYEANARLRNVEDSYTCSAYGNAEAISKEYNDARASLDAAAERFAAAEAVYTATWRALVDAKA